MLNSKINLSILVRSMGSGGAERQLIELVRRLDTQCFNIVILLFYAEGELLSMLADIEHIQIINLIKRSRWDFFGFVKALVRQIVETQSDILYGYLDVPNIFAVLAGKIARIKVVYGVRSTHVDFARYDWTAGIVYRVEALLSRFADSIIVNSQTGLSYHGRHGFAIDKMCIIPNGIDTKHFRRDPILRKEMRLKWGISEQHTLIGLVARLDPMKDHTTFLRMAAVLQDRFLHTRFVCVGDGPDAYLHELLELAEALSLGEKLVWGGPHFEMPAVYSALDIFVSSSYGEGFSNVIGEAMACETPCVVTNVGDSARIVGETGRIVAPKAPAGLAEAVSELLQLSADSRFELGRQARVRIQKYYSVEKMVASTEELFEELVRNTG